MESPLFEHSYSVRKEGIRGLVAVCALLAGLAGAILWFREISTGGWIFITLAAAALLTALFLHVIPHLRGDGRFVLRIFPARIVCESPVRAGSKSFDLPLSDLAHLEVDERVDNPDWFIVTRSGERYKITKGYSLPVKRVVEILTTAAPELPVMAITGMGRRSPRKATHRAG